MHLAVLGRAFAEPASKRRPLGASATRTAQFHDFQDDIRTIRGSTAAEREAPPPRLPYVVPTGTWADTTGSASVASMISKWWR